MRGSVVKILRRQATARGIKTQKEWRKVKKMFHFLTPKGKHKLIMETN